MLSPVTAVAASGGRGSCTSHYLHEETVAANIQYLVHGPQLLCLLTSAGVCQERGWVGGWREVGRAELKYDSKMSRKLWQRQHQHQQTALLCGPGPAVRRCLDIIVSAVSALQLISPCFGTLTPTSTALVTLILVECIYCIVVISPRMHIMVLFWGSAAMQT